MIKDNCIVNDLVSVIMPVGENEKESNYMRSIQSLLDTAIGQIEILFLADGWNPSPSLFDEYSQIRLLPSKKNLGERKTVNRGAMLARGKYIFRIDAHCKMSDNWDVILKNGYGEKMLIVCTLDALCEKTWSELNHNYIFVYVNSSCEEKWWGNCHINDPCKSMQETMTLTGCGWFCDTNYFNNSLRFDESLGKWGCIGPEMSVKVFQSEGKIYVHKKVKCAHLFNSNSKGYPVSVVSETRKKILQKYHKELYELAEKFKPVPSWENVKEDYLENWEKYFMYNTDVTREDKTEIKDANGIVIKKIIKKYKPIAYKGKENPDIPEIGNKITKDAKLSLIKVAERVKEGVWKFKTYETEQEIQMWLFENE
jgi:glycosyltransferase involved in cell wall biosynthesis